MNLIQQEYVKTCNTPSDINEHLPVLYRLAKDCNSVIEFGVRFGASTKAFLYADVPLTSYDLFIDNEVNNLFNYVKQYRNDVEYIKANVLDIDINQTDLLFIDTLHTYVQLKQELKLHGNKANKYLIFHDTYTFGMIGEDGSQGLLPAIEEFLIENYHWQIPIHK